MEIPSPAAGVVGELPVKVGDTVSEGDLILTVSDTSGGRGEPPPRPGRARAPRGPAPAAPASPAPVDATRRPGARRRRRDGAAAGRRGAERAGGEPTATPSTPGPACGGWPASSASTWRAVTGTGPQGPHHQGGRERRRRVGRRRPPGAGAGRGGPRRACRRWPQVDFAKFGPVEVVEPLTRIQRIAGPALHRNWVDDPARHPARRGRHHRARGLPQARSTRTTPSEGVQAHDGRVAAEGLRRGAARVPRRSTPRSTGERPRPQALLPPRLRGRHARRGWWCR